METDVLVGELRDPSPGEPGDPGEPGFNEADDGGLDRLLLVEPEKASLKLGFCRPDRVDFPSTSLSSGSFTVGVGVGERGMKQKKKQKKNRLSNCWRACSYSAPKKTQTLMYVMYTSI